MRKRFQGFAIWTADHALGWGGLALLVLGVTAWRPALYLGSTALPLAFIAWVTEWNGIAVPRPGRVPIMTRGCWETPFAFTVRRRKAVWLFSRDGKAGDGCEWSQTYAVRRRPDEGDVDPRWELPLPAVNDWTLVGRIPAASLRFEHHERVSYVHVGSLDQALENAMG
jgi:hypothetical protein